MSDFADVIYAQANAAQVAVSTIAVEAKVSGTAQDGRQRLIIIAPESLSSDTLYWDVESAVSIGTTAQAVLPGETLAFPFGSEVPVYLKTSSGSVNVIVQEWS